VADRIVIMNQGRIEQTGTPDEVFHHPASEFVMTFLGNVNLFHGRMEAGRTTLSSEANGHNARMFVRPHELEIERLQSNGSSVAARVQRIQSAGPIVRVELARPETGAIIVEMTHERYRDLSIRTGDSVFVRVRDARVFAVG
jgi:sulfate/thiosulfate transport system ATP-binding protein